MLADVLQSSGTWVLNIHFQKHTLCFKNLSYHYTNVPNVPLFQWNVGHMCEFALIRNVLPNYPPPHSPLVAALSWQPSFWFTVRAAGVTKFQAVCLSVAPYAGAGSVSDDACEHICFLHRSGFRMQHKWANYSLSKYSCIHRYKC